MAMVLVRVQCRCGARRHGYRYRCGEARRGEERRLRHSSVAKKGAEPRGVAQPGVTRARHAVRCRRGAEPGRGTGSTSAAQRAVEGRRVGSVIAVGLERKESGVSWGSVALGRYAHASRSCCRGERRSNVGAAEDRIWDNRKRRDWLSKCTKNILWRGLNGVPRRGQNH